MMGIKLSSNLFQVITIFYLLMLGFGAGAIITLGAFSAPVIFRDSLILTNGAISVFQAGLIMTEIFSRASYLLLFIAILIALYEVLTATVYSKKRFLIFGAVAILAILAFVLYYLPAIVQLQQGGEDAIATGEFENLHKQSVWAFYVAFFALLALFSSRVQLLLRQASEC